MASPLHHQQAKAKPAPGGDSQCIGQAERLRIVEVEIRMRSQTHCPVMNHQRAHVMHGLLEAAMIKCKADGHHSTGKGSQYKQRTGQREPGAATHRGDELHVSPAHTAGEMEQQKNQAANQSAGSRRSQLPPSAKAEMQQQAKQDCRKCKSVRYPAAYHVIRRAYESAKKRACRVHKLDIQSSHGVLSGRQFKVRSHRCKFHIGRDPDWSRS